MKSSHLFLSLFVLSIFPPVSLASDIESLADYDIEMDFSMSYEENLEEGISGSLRGTYVLSTDSDDEVYWSVDYNCGLDLLITDKNPLEESDYEVVYEMERECTPSSLGWEYLISQGEVYQGGLSIGGQDFIQDGAHYWYQFTLDTIDEVSDVVELETMVGDFTIEFDELDEPFSDVQNHWAENYINSLATLGDVSGYGDDTFRPDQNISRAEILVIALNALRDPYSENDSCTYDFDLEKDYSVSYTDVDDSHWGFSYIEAATEAGVITGYEDGTFKPDQAVTRAEALSILLETYFTCGDYHGIDDWYPNYDRHTDEPVENDGMFWSAYLEQGYSVASEENLTLGFSDVTEDWQRFYIHFADLHGVADGYSNSETGLTEFRPNLPVTRAEIAKMAWKLRVDPHQPEPF